MQNVRAQARTLNTVAPKAAQLIRQFASDSRHILKDHLVAEYLFGSYPYNDT